MAKKFLKSLFIAIVLIPQGYSSVFAHPPTEIQMIYDKEKKILHVEMTHVTHFPRKQYIRRLLIFKNDALPAVYNFSKQETTQKFVKDIPLELTVGDTIRIKVFCSRGGIGEQSLTVTDSSDASETSFQP